MESLYQLLNLEAAELQLRFQKASISGKGTPQEVADLRENAVQDFVGRFFPFPYRIAKGNIRDVTGNASDSIDCILLNPSHPYTVDSHGKFQLILADGVDAAIEVKPDLSSTTELERGLRQGGSVKRLRRAQSGVLHSNTHTVHEQWAYRIPYFIFSMQAKADPLDTGREIIEYYRTNAIERLDQADVVVVNNVGLLVNIQTPKIFPWTLSLPDADKVGWFFCSWKEATLVGFLLHLHLVPHARMKLQDDMLLPYLRQARFHGLHRIGAYPPYDPGKPI